MKILMVDDEQSFLEQAVLFLERDDRDFDISTSLGPKEALEKLDNDDFDAIVSDYQMPEINGLDFLQILREERGDDIPFIIFTGKGREDVAMKALNVGADRYLQKGGDPMSQFNVLAQAIDQEVTHHRTKKKNEELTTDLQETFDTIAHPIFLLDDHHRILRTNEAAGNSSMKMNRTSWASTATGLLISRTNR